MGCVHDMKTSTHRMHGMELSQHRLHGCKNARLGAFPCKIKLDSTGSSCLAMALVRLAVRYRRTECMGTASSSTARCSESALLPRGAQCLGLPRGPSGSARLSCTCDRPSNLTPPDAFTILIDTVSERNSDRTAAMTMPVQVWRVSRQGVVEAVAHPTNTLDSGAWHGP